MVFSSNLSEPDKHQQFLESIINIQTEMICRFLPDTTLTFVNKGYCEFFKASSEELIGKKWLDAVPGDQHPMISNHLDYVAKSGEIITYEHQVEINGRLCWQQWTDYPLFDSQGRLVEFQAVGRDITRSKEHEQKLTEISQSKDHILATVAHDLRDPISGIIGLCRMMERENPKEEHLLYLKLIRESCHASLNIMEELLEMAQLENESFQLERHPENLVDIILEVQWGFEHLAQEKNIRLENKIKAKRVMAMVNRPRFQRVLTNILSNALKFTEEGGTVSIGLGQSPGKIILFVEDTGIGIPAELTTCIFDKFTRGKRSGLQGEKTHGLGLYICKQIVEMHQGIIYLESQEGEGTTVTIELPAIQLED